MTLAALGLVLLAAFTHATWNLLAKRVGGGAPFVWSFACVATLAYAPLAAAVVVVVRPRIGPIEILFCAGTIVLHLIYFLMLQGAYRLGDLSLVYPLARGTGPMLAAAAAVAFMGERPTPVAVAGIVLIGAGVVLLAGNPAALARRGARRGAAYALLTGVAIASYTLWDKHAVSALAIPPILYDWANSFGRAVLVTPVAVRRWPEVRALWAAHRAQVLWVGVLSPAAYILVLTALVFSPVSYIAPAREISILIGTLMGTRLLAEGDEPRRLAAAAAMLLGLVGLAVG